MHLSAKTDTCYLALVYVCNQLFDTLDTLRIPVLRFLLRPAWMRKIQRILPGYDIDDFAASFHQKKLHGTGS